MILLVFIKVQRQKWLGYVERGDRTFIPKTILKAKVFIQEERMSAIAMKGMSIVGSEENVSKGMAS